MTDFSPTHPGVVLRQDFLKPMGLSQYALAKAIGVPQIRVSETVNAKRAIREGTGSGTQAGYWQLFSDYDGISPTHLIRYFPDDRRGLPPFYVPV